MHIQSPMMMTCRFSPKKFVEDGGIALCERHQCCGDVRYLIERRKGMFAYDRKCSILEFTFVAPDSAVSTDMIRDLRLVAWNTMKLIADGIFMITHVKFTGDVTISLHQEVEKVSAEGERHITHKSASREYTMAMFKTVPNLMGVKSCSECRDREKEQEILKELVSQNE